MGMAGCRAAGGGARVWGGIQSPTCADGRTMCSGVGGGSEHRDGFSARRAHWLPLRSSGGGVWRAGGRGWDAPLRGHRWPHKRSQASWATEGLGVETARLSAAPASHATAPVPSAAQTWAHRTHVTGRLYPTGGDGRQGTREGS